METYGEAICGNYQLDNARVSIANLIETASDNKVLRRERETYTHVGGEDWDELFMDSN